VLNLEKMIESNSEFKGKGLMSRLFASVEQYMEEKDYITNKKVHYFVIKQTHGTFDLIMDWQYKLKMGKNPPGLKIP